MQSHYNPNTRVLTTEIFTGTERGKVLSAMDARDQALRAEGNQLVTRRAIGRNSSCPCGSGRKFKKCCIDKAHQVG